MDSGRPELYPYQDLCRAPEFHILDRVSTASLSIGFDTVKLRAQNDPGGTVNLQVHYCEQRDDKLDGLTQLYSRCLLRRRLWVRGHEGVRTSHRAGCESERRRCDV